MQNQDFENAFHLLARIMPMSSHSSRVGNVRREIANAPEQGYAQLQHPTQEDAILITWFPEENRSHNNKPTGSEHRNRMRPLRSAFNGMLPNDVLSYQLTEDWIAVALFKSDIDTIQRTLEAKPYLVADTYARLVDVGMAPVEKPPRIYSDTPVTMAIDGDAIAIAKTVIDSVVVNYAHPTIVVLESQIKPLRDALDSCMARRRTSPPVSYHEAYETLASAVTDFLNQVGM